MDKNLRDKLEEWLGKNFAIQTETTGTSVCGMTYNKNKIKREINIVFTRYFHADEPSEYVMEDVGYVLVLPSFWMSVHKPLVLAYIESYIDGYIRDHILCVKKEEDKGCGCNHPPHVPPDAYIPGKPRPPRKPPMPAVKDNPFGQPTEIANIGASPEEIQELIKPMEQQVTGGFKNTTRQQ